MQDCAHKRAISTGDGRMLSDQARLVVAVLSQGDFDAGDGQTALAGSLVHVGHLIRQNNKNQDLAWYASHTSAWHAATELRDVSLAGNGMTSTRVVHAPTRARPV